MNGGIELFGWHRERCCQIRIYRNLWLVATEFHVIFIKSIPFTCLFSCAYPLTIRSRIESRQMKINTFYTFGCMVYWQSIVHKYLFLWVIACLTTTKLGTRRKISWNANGIIPFISKHTHTHRSFAGLILLVFLLFGWSINGNAESRLNRISRKVFNKTKRKHSTTKPKNTERKQYAIPI